MYKNRDGDIVEAKDGFYDPSDGSIHVDLNADNVLFTVSHELVHFIRDWSPKQFKKLADLVMKGFNRQNVSAEELILAKQAEYAESDIQLTEEQAFEEVIAASLEGIMADGRVMELMREAEAKDKGLGAKLRQFFQDIGRMIRDTISSYKDAVPGSPEGRLIRKMEDLYSQLQEAFAEGVMDAGENFQNAENTTGEGGVRYKVLINVLGSNGIVYDKVVQPGTLKYEQTRRNRDKYRKHLHDHVFNRKFHVENFDGENVVVEFADSWETVKKDGFEEHPALGKMEHTSDGLTKLAIINAKELINNSVPEKPKSENKHGWLDKFGWQDRKAIMLYDNVLYPVIIHIANAEDGRHILYEISVLKKRRTRHDTLRPGSYCKKCWSSCHYKKGQAGCQQILCSSRRENTTTRGCCQE